MSNEIVKTDLTNITQFKKIAEDKMKQFGLDEIQVLKEISFALQHLDKNKSLQGCTPESKLKSVVNIASVGLTLNPVAKEAYLVPRWNSTIKGMECCLEPSYIGLVKLLTDTGSIESIICQIVYKNDKFSFNIADSTNPITHSPTLVKSERGEMLGAYALATLPNGKKQAEWMDVSEINDIRDRSESWKAYSAGKISTCVWLTDYTEMARKTVIRRIYKYLPRTEKMERVDNAIAIDNSDYEITNEQIYLIDDLMDAVGYTDDEKKFKRMEVQNMNASDAAKFIDELRQKQNEFQSSPDMVLNASQKTISKHIQKISQ